LAAAAANGTIWLLTIHEEESYELTSIDNLSASVRFPVRSRGEIKAISDSGHVLMTPYTTDHAAVWNMASQSLTLLGKEFLPIPLELQNGREDVFNWQLSSDGQYAGVSFFDGYFNVTSHTVCSTETGKEIWSSSDTITDFTWSTNSRHFATYDRINRCIRLHESPGSPVLASVSMENTPTDAMVECYPLLPELVRVGNTILQAPSYRRILYLSPDSYPSGNWLCAPAPPHKSTRDETANSPGTLRSPPIGMNPRPSTSQSQRLLNQELQLLRQQMSTISNAPASPVPAR